MFFLAALLKIMATKNKNKKQILLFVQIAKLIIGDEA